MEMPWRRCRWLLASALLVAALLTAQMALGRKKEKSGAMDDQKRALHALNRLTFGPRPGDVDRVAQMGVDRWIDLELHPDRIDDSALDARLAPFRTLRMDTNEIVENFPPEQLIRQIADGKATLPRDPVRRAVYEAQLQRYEDKQERKQQAAKSAAAEGDEQNPSGGKDGASSDDADQKLRRAERRAVNLKAQELLDLPPDERMKEILQMSPEERKQIASTAQRRQGGRADGGNERSAKGNDAGAQESRTGGGR